MNEYIEANRANWNDRVPIHVASQSYDVDGFVADSTKLRPGIKFDSEHLGDVNGKSLLHLMCHFGLDTLSWARLGATVTGVDFSANAIESAQQISERIGIESKFVQSDIYDAPNVLSERFDIVYTSVGVLCWLPDIRHWARVVL